MSSWQLKVQWCPEDTVSQTASVLTLAEEMRYRQLMAAG